MFKLTRPCKTCPFLVSNGRNFGLPLERLMGIIHATAFQCHSTVDYSEDEPGAGAKPQQCAGLLTLLYREGRDNQIMQVAQRFKAWDPSKMIDEGIFPSLEEAFIAHTGESREVVRRALAMTHLPASMVACEQDTEEQ